MVNLVQRFLLEDLDIRGTFVKLDSEWQEVLTRRNYSDSIVELLGQATAVVLLMSSNIKFNGKLTLQLQSEGDLDLLIVQSNKVHEFRSFARNKGNVIGNDLTQITQKGIFVITIEANIGDKPYQGLVSVDFDSMAENIETYFNQSEQIQTMLVLRANNHQVAGLLLQALPDTKADNNDWERLRYMAETLSLEELKSIDRKTLINKMFAEDNVTVYPHEEASFQCACSEEKTLSILSGLDVKELAEIVKDSEPVTISCDFCGKKYRHDVATVNALLANKIHPN